MAAAICAIEFLKIKPMKKKKLYEVGGDEIHSQKLNQLQDDTKC